MTREEAKHISEVFKAYSEGKTIQSKDKQASDKSWEDVPEDVYAFSTYESEFRVKPEPKLIPYKNAEEFLQAQKEHGIYIYIRYGYFDTPIRILDTGIAVISFDLNVKRYNECVFIPYSLLLRDFKWQDGTPCGILTIDKAKQPKIEIV